MFFRRALCDRSDLIEEGFGKKNKERRRPALGEPDAFFFFRQKWRNENWRHGFKRRRKNSSVRCHVSAAAGGS